MIASFVLGLGESANQTTPQVSWSFDYDDGGGGGNGDQLAGSSSEEPSTGRLTVTHDGGDTVDANRLTATDSDGDTGVTGNSIDIFGGLEVSAGQTASFTIGSDDTINIVWTDADKETSSTLATYEGPDA